MPFLLCLAENDEVISEGSGMANAIKYGVPDHTKTVVVPDANHVFAEVRAEEVAEISLDFLAEAL